jgi:hypothetical protein
MTRIPLHPHLFRSAERELLTADDFTVTTFRYENGVSALRVANSAGEMTLLPFQGQQIWDLQLYGRRQTMRSMFSKPVPRVPYLQTYGAFLIHCGFTAMGGPGPEDTHELHGELPNAPYDESAVLMDEDEHGPYLGVTGSWEYAHSFGAHYCATPEVRMYPRSGALRVIFSATNLNRRPMEYMYLCHVNFRPVDGSDLLYTAPCDADHIRVRSNIPSHISVDDRYRDFLSELARDPAQHNHLDPGLPFDPEAVLFLDMKTDKEGFAHAMQRLPTGEADFISYRPRELDHAVRWICRTPDQEGLGIVLPATAEPDGYSAERAKGNIKTLAAGATYRCDFYTGALTIPATLRYQEHITGTLSGTAARIDPVALDAESH